MLTQKYCFIKKDIDFIYLFTFWAPNLFIYFLSSQTVGPNSSDGHIQAPGSHKPTYRSQVMLG